MAKKEAKLRNLMMLKIPLTEAEKILEKQIKKGNGLLKDPVKTSVSLKIAEKLYNHWNGENYDILKKIFQYTNIAQDYSISTWSIGGILISDLKLTEKIEKLHSNIHDKIAKLESITAGLLLLDDEAKVKAESQKVFFVHGTDCDTSAGVLDFLNELGLEPIIIKDLALAGKTIIDEIQKRSEVKYAIGLLTPDNLGGTHANELNFRADQNVLLELGIFIGKLGRENVSTLFVEGVELPEDFHGYEYIEIDRSDEWKTSLIEELQAAGFELGIS
ncbi:MAG: nucleotide-binding protein [Candidatus Cloacimonadales bacterium]|nr:nucleotide-binding protein [Candidatus Cloacimonadales bacterium]